MFFGAALMAAGLGSYSCQANLDNAAQDAGADSSAQGGDLDAAFALCPSIGREIKSGEPCLLPEGSVCRVGCLSLLAQCKGGTWTVSTGFDAERCPTRIPAEGEPCGTCGPSVCSYGCEVGRPNRINTQAICTPINKGSTWRIVESACRSTDAGASDAATDASSTDAQDAATD
jgi:hypothetical protein